MSRRDVPEGTRMPGEEGDRARINYRQWYAMRNRLIQAGRWRGAQDLYHNPPGHRVPALEEGEPQPRRPRLGPLRDNVTDGEPEPQFRALAPDTPSSGNDSTPVPGTGLPAAVPESEPSTPDSLPPLESPETAEGTYGQFGVQHLAICKG